MGKYIYGINGPILGKVGPVVGSTWKGQPYLKSLPARRGSKRKPGEKRNQSKMATAHYWLKPVIDFVREGFKGYSPTAEGFNGAKSYVLTHAFADTENLIILPALVQVSYGDLFVPANITVEKTDGYTLCFNWDTYCPDDASQYDQAMLLAYDIEKKEKSMKLTGQFRSTGTDTLKLMSTKGFTYHVYIAFTAHDRSRQSHSMYLGTIDT